MVVEGTVEVEACAEHGEAKARAGSCKGYCDHCFKSEGRLGVAGYWGRVNRERFWIRTLLETATTYPCIEIPTVERSQHTTQYMLVNLAVLRGVGLSG